MTSYAEQKPCQKKPRYFGLDDLIKCVGGQVEAGMVRVLVDVVR